MYFYDRLKLRVYKYLSQVRLHVRQILLDKGIKITRQILSTGEKMFKAQDKINN